MRTDQAVGGEVCVDCQPDASGSTDAVGVSTFNAEEKQDLMDASTFIPPLDHSNLPTPLVVVEVR